MSPTDVFASSTDTGVAPAGVVHAQRQYVIMGADQRRFGIAIESLREVIPPSPYTPLPGSADSVCGLINLRGRIVTVVDLGSHLGFRSCRTRADHRIAILEHGPNLVGLAVEDVIGIDHADPDELRRSAEALRGVDPEAGHVKGIGGGPGREYVVIDAGELFRTVLA